MLFFLWLQCMLCNINCSQMFSSCPAEIRPLESKGGTTVGVDSSQHSENWAPNQTWYLLIHYPWTPSPLSAPLSLNFYIASHKGWHYRWVHGQLCSPWCPPHPNKSFTQSQEFLKELGRRVKYSWLDELAASFRSQRIFVAVQQWNSVLIIGRLRGRTSQHFPIRCFALLSFYLCFSLLMHVSNMHSHLTLININEMYWIMNQSLMFY